MADLDVSMTDTPVPDPGPEVTIPPILDPDTHMTGSGTKRPLLDIASLSNKRFKTSELPLTEEQTSTIEKLIYTFKKKGGFDSVRKKVWAKYEESVRTTYEDSRCSFKSLMLI